MVNRKSIEEALKFSVSDPKKMDGLSERKAWARARKAWEEVDTAQKNGRKA